MTKPRAPLSIEDAIDRIAGQVPGGKKALAAIVDRSARTVHNWSDPDTPEQIPMDCAIALDIAYQRAGGEGAPIFETYAHQLELARVDCFSDQAELARRAGIAAKEGGEALQAVIAASMPGATRQDCAHAVREVLEAVDALNGTLPALTKGTGPAGGGGEGGSPGGGL